MKLYLSATKKLIMHVHIMYSHLKAGWMIFMWGYNDINLFSLLNVNYFTAECDELGCDQICVNMPLTGPRCYCGDGYELQEDQKTCVGKEDQIPRNWKIKTI